MTEACLFLQTMMSVLPGYMTVVRASAVITRLAVTGVFVLHHAALAIRLMLISKHVKVGAML